MTTKVLIIDDDQSLIPLFEPIRTNEKLAFHQENTGSAGLEWATENKPDLVILAVELKDINGFMVCKKLRESPVLKRTPIIVISATVGEKEFEKHKKLKTRADIYLRKPLVPRSLFEMMGQLLAVDITLRGLDENDGLDLEKMLLESDEFPELPDDEISLSGENDQTDVIAELNTQIENMQHQIEYYKKELDASKMFFSSMQDKKGGEDVDSKKKAQEIERLSFELKEANDALTKEREEFTNLEKEKKDILETQNEMSEQVQSLNSALSEAEEQIDDLNGELVRCQQELEQAKDQAEGKVSEFTTMEERQAELEKELEEVRAELGTAQGKLDEKDQVNRTRDTAFQSEIKELESALEQARATNQEIEEILTDRESEILAMKDALKSLQVEKSEVEKGSKDHEKELHRLQREKEEAIEQLTQEFQNESETAKQKMETEMQAQIDELQTSFDQRLTELDQQLTESDQSLEAMKQRLEQAHQENQTIEENKKKEIQELEKRLQGELAVLQNQIQEYGQTNTELKTELHEKQTQCEGLQSELDQKGEELSAFQQQVNDLREKEAVLIRKQDEEIRSIEKGFTERIEELDSQIKQNFSLQEELCEQRDLLKSELAEKTEEIKSLQDLVKQQEAKCQLEMENLEKRNAKIIADQEAQILEHRKEVEILSETQAEVQTLQGEKKALNKRVEQLELGHQTLKNRIQQAENILVEGLKNLKGETETLDFEE